jgi:hypothetical protein
MHNKDFPPEFQQGNSATQGDYGPNGKKFFEFLSHYKFYLNFENSNCKYVFALPCLKNVIDVFPLVPAT